MTYEYLIFDLDGTLLDYKKAQERAIERVMLLHGLSFNDYIGNYLKELSLKEWQQAGLQHQRAEHVQKNYHQLYHSYLQSFFQQFQQAFSLAVSPEELVKTYQQALSQEAPLIPDALAVCQELSKHFFLFLAANGLLEVQLKRLEILRPYFRKLFISEHIGHIKPSQEFFRILLSQPEVEPAKCLMIGDSLSADILGGASAGMNTCWYNPQRKNNMTTIHPDLEVHSLKELLALIP